MPGMRDGVKQFQCSASPQRLLVSGLLMLTALPLLLPLPACTTTQPQQTSSAAATVPAPRARTLRLGVPDSPQAIRADDPPWWRDARTLDAMDLQRLAEQEGALTLLEAAQQGGARGALALRAFAWAPDARSARNQLCGLLQRVVLEDRIAVVQAVQRTLAAPSTWGEELDPDGDAVCREQLSALLDETDSTPSERR